MKSAKKSYIESNEGSALRQHLSQIGVAGAEAFDRRALDPVLLDEIVFDLELFGGRENRMPPVSTSVKCAELSLIQMRCSKCRRYPLAVTERRHEYRTNQ